MAFRRGPDCSVCVSAERMDKRGAVFAVGDPQKHSICRARCPDGDPVAPFSKNGQDRQMDVAGGHVELFVLYSGRVVLTGIAVDRNADAAENLHVCLDDRHVLESK